MSALCRPPSSPSWKTMKAEAALTALEASLRAGRTNRSQSRSTERDDCPLASSHWRKVCPSSRSRALARSVLQMRRIAAMTRSFSLHPRWGYARKEGSRCSGAGQPRTRAEDAHAPVRVQHRHAEAALPRRPVQHAEALQEADVRAAAAEEDVLAVVDLLARLRVSEGEGPAAQERALLDQRDAVAVVEEGAGGGEAGKAASDHHAVARRRMGRRLCSHNRTIRNSFSLPDRETRLAYTS